VKKEIDQDIYDLVRKAIREIPEEILAMRGEKDSELKDLVDYATVACPMLFATTVGLINANIGRSEALQWISSTLNMTFMALSEMKGLGIKVTNVRKDGEDGLQDEDLHVEFDCSGGEEKEEPE